MKVTRIVALALLVAAPPGCADKGAKSPDAGPAADGARDLPGGGEAGPDGPAPDVTPWPSCTKPWVKGAQACRPTFDSCTGDELPLPGGGCKRVGLKLCTGGLEAPPAWTCQPVGPPTTCRTGWSKGSGGVCAPILPAAACSAGSMALIGQSACQPVGDCGSGTYGAIVTTAATLFVDGSYTGGGSDGSQAKPYTSVGAAVQAAAQGGHVAVAAGQYVEDVALSKPITLEGRCAKLVTIKGVKGGIYDAAVKITAAGVTVRGIGTTGAGMGVYVTGAAAQASVERVAVSGVLGFGVGADVGAKLTLSDALVEGATGVGIFVEGAQVTLQRVEVRGTKPDPSYGDQGYGVLVTYLSAYSIPATLKLTDSVVQQNLSLGIYVAGAEATLEGAVVRETKPDPSNSEGGIGVLVLSTSAQKGKLTLKESLLADNRTAGLDLTDAVATVERSVIEGTEARAKDSALGVGILAEHNASSSMSSSVLILKQSLISGNRTAGVLVRGSQATIERSVIEKTRAQAKPQLYGYGLQLQRDGLPATLTLRDSLVTQSRTAGAVVHDSTLVAERSAFTQTQPRQADQVAGFGVGAVGQAGTATLELTDCLVAQNRTAGLALVNAAATLERTLIRDTAAEASGGEFGHGLTLKFSQGSTTPQLTMRQCVVARSREAGISLQDASATIRNSLVRETKSDAAGAYGDGISQVKEKLGGLALELTDSPVRDSARAGLYVSGAGGQAQQCAFTGGVFSVVLEQAATMTLGPSNLYTGNKVDEPRWGQGLPSAKAPAVPDL